VKRVRVVAVLSIGVASACSAFFPFDGLTDGSVDSAVPREDVSQNDANVPDGDVKDAADGSIPCPDGGRLCSSSCVAIKTDPKNCGSCGVECKVGTCNGGYCSTIVIPGDLGEHDRVATNGVIVAWLVRKATESRIFSRNVATLDAGPTRELSLPPACYDLALTPREFICRTERSVYLLSTAIGATPIEFATVGVGESVVGVLASDLSGTTSVVYLVRNEDGSLLSVFRGVVGGAAPIALVNLSLLDRGVSHVANFGNEAFFFMVDGTKKSDILRLKNAFTGTLSAEIVSVSQDSPGGLSVDPAGLVWTAASVPPTARSAVVLAPRAGGTERAVARGTETDVYSGVSSDETNAYWAVTSGNPVVRRIARDGGDTPVSVGIAGGAPTPLLVTKDFVFWVRKGDLVALPR
jgi:hypothetical protein